MKEIIYGRAYLNDYTKRLGIITEIFARKLGIDTQKIFFCTLTNNDNNFEINCYKEVEEKAKQDINASLKYFEENKNNLLYQGQNYYVTNKFPCFKYLDGDFIAAFRFDIGYVNQRNEIINEYFVRQIENYLLYIIPIINHNKNIYPEFFIESQIDAVTKTLIEEKIPAKIKLVRIPEVTYVPQIEMLSRMTYEGEYLRNKCLVITNIIQNLDVKLTNGVGLNETKKVRKLLEMTCKREKENYLGLLYDANLMLFVGLISTNEIKGYYVKIVFENKGRWSIYFNDSETRNKITMVDSKICIQNQERENKIFREIFQNKFGNKNSNEALNLVNRAREQKHGTMIVFSDHALTEGKRLKDIGYEVDFEGDTEEKFIEQLTSIDGSVLATPEGKIISIGVILDGNVSEGCDISNSRGARYNSAIRYTYSRSIEQEKCIAVVISEDGDVDIITDGKTILKPYDIL